MAFKARTLIGIPNEPNASGLAPPREVGGLLIPSRRALFPGDPPDELLADDLIDVRTLQGDAWPRSSCDRHCRAPRKMELAQRDGLWPTEREKALQVFVEAKLADPEYVGRELLKQQGLTQSEIDKRIARMKASSKNIPNIPPKRGPGRPRKSAEE